MKLLVVLLFAFIGMSCQAVTPATKKETAPALKAENKEASKVKLPGEKEEDCDEKAKKKVEIKPESISLTGNTGCSLDEVK